MLLHEDFDECCRTLVKQYARCLATEKRRLTIVACMLKIDRWAKRAIQACSHVHIREGRREDVMMLMRVSMRMFMPG